MEDLALSKYLDIIPLPALVFTSEGETLATNSLRVCYVNKAFLRTIGDSPEREEPYGISYPPPTEELLDNFLSILQVQCINPSASHFLAWVNDIAQAPHELHQLKTRFKGFTLAEDGELVEPTPQFVDIEWNAVVMDNKFIVLSGRRVGTVQFSPISANASNLSDDTESPVAVIDEEEDEDGGKEVKDPHTVLEPSGRVRNKTTPSSSTSSGSSLRRLEPLGRPRTKSGPSSSSSASSSAKRTRVRDASSRGFSSSTNKSERSRLASVLEDHQTAAYRWRHSERFVKAMGGGSETGKLIHEIDWSKTELGAMDHWNQILTSMTSLVLTSTHPMALWWGQSHILIYNDGYIPVAGNKHPTAFGDTAKRHYDELWPTLEPVIEDVMKGESVYTEDSFLLMHRHGYPEETYFTWSYIPIRDENGDVLGFLNPCFESTSRILAERRLRTLRELDINTARCRSMLELGKSIVHAFTYNPFDVPFALVYFCSSDYGTTFTGSTNAGSSTELGRRISLQPTHSSSTNATDKTDPAVWVYRLQDTVGIPETHPLAPKVVEINMHRYETGISDEEDEIHVWPFRKMSEQQQLIGIRELSPDVLEGIEQQGWPELPTDAIAVPIMGGQDFSRKDTMVGMLVLGINPRREFDETYQTFADMCGRQIAAAMNMVKNIEDEVARAEELATLNQERTSFFNSVSHELRTPLTLILGPLEECLEDPSLSQQHKGRLDLARRNGRRLLRLVNSLLDFSRVEAGRMTASFRETNLQRYTADLASLFRSAIEKGGVKYVVDVGGKEKKVWVDREMWEKIVFNIIGNAFKFTLSGQITVTCRLADDNRHMLFSVRDTGIGIPSHEVSRIFEKFHRVHDQKGRSYEGTGIGLALTQELVRLHGGKLEVESTFGVGTTFVILLRLGYSHLPEDQVVLGSDLLDTTIERDYGASVVEEASRWSIPATGSDQLSGRALSTASSDTNSTTALRTNQWLPISSRGCRILVADDNEDMRRYVKGVLSQFYEVIEAANGQDALSIAVQGAADLILSDIMMPTLGGYGLLKVIRSSPETRSTPFILLSAQAGEEARVEGLLAGADDYLAKPFSAKELIARVHTHLDIARMRAELEKSVKERTKDLMESEERYRILSAISPVGVFRVDTSGTITYANSKWRDITCIDESLDDSTGEVFLAAVHPDDREYMRQLWETALENTESCTFEARWGSSKNFRWAMGEVVPEVIGEHILGFVGVLTDVTDRRQMEEEKLDAAEEVRSQQELAIDVICHELRNPLNGIYHNADIVLESVNNIREEMIKFREELARSHNTPDLAVITYLPKDSRAIAHLFDFLESELTQDLESLESLNLCAKHQKRIADDVLQMSKLSMNLVSLTRTSFDPLVETGNVIRMFEREAVVKGITFKFTLGPRYHDLEIGWVSADPIRFAQVLINFISNAVRFTEKAHRREIEVTLDALEREPQLSDILMGSSSAVSQFEEGLTPEEINSRVFLIASVADSGVGLTPEERSNLFQKFSQASPRTHIEYGGSGLGLFISKALVEVQGGRIALESEKDRGTKLTFYIQAIQVATPPISKAVDTTRSRTPLALTPKIKRTPSSTPVLDQTRLIRVLIVEDNLINQKVLTRQLEMAGFHTAVANHGDECLELLRKGGNQYDIILMDLEMPIKSGFEAATEIRARENAGELEGRTPIIAVTGNARNEYIDRASEIGIDGFIVKPYEKAILIEKIRSLV